MSEVRENRAIFYLIALALTVCFVIAYVGDMALSKSPHIPTFVCSKAHFKQYEDGSGHLSCNGKRVVIVHVPW